ncbi:hypothetical protein RYX36_024420, partial [Vicia faba]
KGYRSIIDGVLFHTHRKKDQSWVGVHGESAYDKFERKNLEISSQNPTISGENEADSQSIIGIPLDLDIWI